MTERTFMRLGGAFAFLSALLALIWRWHVAGGLEPRWDQAGYFIWLESILESRHVLPIGPLEADDSSALYNLLHLMSSQPQLLLTSTDGLISLPFLLLGGVRYGALLAAGLTASALSVGLVCFILLKQGGDRSQQVRFLAAGAGGAALLLNGYSVHYSGFVLHNFGAFFLLLCAVMLEDCAREGRRKRLWGGLLLLAALYSHWTVVLLLPPALYARLFFAGALSWRRRLAGLGQLSLFFFIALFPLVAAVLVMHASSPAAYMELGRYGSEPVLAPFLHRISFWFIEAGELFSYPGLAAGIVGLVLLARRGRWMLPGWLLLTHFLLTAAMPGFTWNGSDTYLRTYLYLVPLLSLGIGVSALALADLRLPFAGIASLAILAHFAGPFGQACTMAAVAKRSPRYAASFMAGQGNLDAAARTITSLVPQGAVVIAEGWGVHDMIFSMIDHSSRLYRSPFTLDNALNRANDGSLMDFFRRRGLSASLLRDPFYILEVEPRSADQVTTDVQRIDSVLAGETPAPVLEGALLAKSHVGAWGMEDIHLYRIAPRR